MQQIEPFKPTFHLGEEVVEFARREDGRFQVAHQRPAPSSTPAPWSSPPASGSFQPRRIGIEGAEAFEGTAIHYRVKNSSRLSTASGW